MTLVYWAQARRKAVPAMHATLFLPAVSVALTLCAQQASERYAGAVLQSDPANRALLVHLDGGGERWITVPPQVRILRITPGDKDVGKASSLPLENIRPGDRVVARSESNASGVAIASQVLILSHSDVLRRQAAERAEWQARGVAGRVVTVDLDRGEIVIITPPRPTARTIAIRVSATTEQRRYRPESARYSDAVPAALVDVRPGDHVQALGNVAGDGAAVLADKLVSGSFHNFVAKILAIDETQRVITLQAVGGGPPVRVRVGPAATVRRLRPEHAAALASLKPAKPGETRQGGVDAQTIFESSPTIALGDLRVGDAVIVATGGNTESSGPLPAVAVIAGADPLLKRSGEAQKELIGSWDLSLDPEEPGGRGGN